MKNTDILLLTDDTRKIFASKTEVLQKIIRGELPSIIECNSNVAGATTTVMVGVHGNELSGVNAVIEMLGDIKIISGKVYFIFANLQALRINQRFFEKNMNRCFHSTKKGNTYEDQRAQELLPFLQESEYLLDVHNTLNTQNSIPFLICEYPNLTEYFDVDEVVCGLDVLHPGGSDGYMNSIGKVGLCLESGSIFDPKGPEIAKNGILNFLKFTGNIGGSPILRDGQELVELDYIYKNTTLDFHFTKKFLDFEKVPAGFVIAYDGEEEVKFDEERVILFTVEGNSIGEECFCVGRGRD